MARLVDGGFFRGNYICKIILEIYINIVSTAQDKFWRGRRFQLEVAATRTVTTGVEGSTRSLWPAPPFQVSPPGQIHFSDGPTFVEFCYFFASAFLGSVGNAPRPPQAANQSEPAMVYAEAMDTSRYEARFRRTRQGGVIIVAHQINDLAKIDFPLSNFGSNMRSLAKMRNL